jgi:hypothetical protein
VVFPPKISGRPLAEPGGAGGGDLDDVDVDVVHGRFEWYQEANLIPVADGWADDHGCVALLIQIVGGGNGHDDDEALATRQRGTFVAATAAAASASAVGPTAGGTGRCLGRGRTTCVAQEIPARREGSSDAAGVGRLVRAFTLVQQYVSCPVSSVLQCMIDGTLIGEGTSAAEQNNFVTLCCVMARYVRGAFVLKFPRHKNYFYCVAPSHRQEKRIVIILSVFVFLCKDVNDKINFYFVSGEASMCTHSSSVVLSSVN